MKKIITALFTILIFSTSYAQKCIDQDNKNPKNKKIMKFEKDPLMQMMH